MENLDGNQLKYIHLQKLEVEFQKPPIDKETIDS